MERTALYERIAGALETLILTERLGQEERLPGEAELARRYGVSRNIVREALKILRERGLVAIRTGEAATVTKPSPDVLGGVISRMLRLSGIEPGQVYEVRRILELDACRLAGGRPAGGKTAARMEELLRRMEAADEPAAWCRCDVLFHREIVRAGGNPLYLMFYDALQQALETVIAEAHRAPGARQAGEAHHRRILEAVRRHDFEAAAALLDIHMNRSMRNIRDAIGESSPDADEKKNRRERYGMPRGTVIDSAAVRSFTVSGAYSSKMLLDRTNSESDGLNLNEGTLRAGRRLPGGAHEGYDEVYYILRGSGTLHMDGAEYPVRKGSVVHIPGGTFHALDNTRGTEDLILLTVWARHPEPGANEVYDQRIMAWGKSFMLSEET